MLGKNEPCSRQNSLEVNFQVENVFDCQTLACTLSLCIAEKIKYSQSDTNLQLSRLPQAAWANRCGDTASLLNIIPRTHSELKVTRFQYCPRKAMCQCF